MTPPLIPTHEAFHLFGAEDLYNRKGAEGFCDQRSIWAGRLMCGYGNLTKNNMFGGSPSAIDKGIFTRTAQARYVAPKTSTTTLTALMPLSPVDDA